MRLWVTGDPIWDVYKFGTYDDVKRRFKTEWTEVRAGGALNVLENARAIAPRGIDVQSTFKIDLSQDIPSLIRLIDRTHLHMEWWDVPGPLDQARDPRWVFSEFNPSAGPSGLIVSDYDKGAVNTPESCNSLRTGNFDFIVVDSRYRSVDQEWLSEVDSLKIWRCTGEEYDQTWGELFDIIVHTDGPRPVRILSKRKLVAELELPSAPPTIDTCGAGDTFTAALAVCMAANRRPYTPDNFFQWSSFAIRCSLDVCSRPLTSISRIHL